MLWKFFVQQQPRSGNSNIVDIQRGEEVAQQISVFSILGNYTNKNKKFFKQKLKKLINLNIFWCFYNEKWNIRRATSRATRIRIN